MRAVDAIYQVLQKHGQPVDVQDLLDEALAVLGYDREPRKLAKLYTELNMDPRFHYKGQNAWELSEWQPRAGGGRAGARDTSADTGSDAGDDELEEDDSWS